MKSLPRRAGKVEDNNERESSLPSLPDEEDEIILNSDDDCEEDEEGGEEDDDYEEDDDEYDEDDEELDEDDEEEGDEEGEEQEEEEEEEGQEHDGEVLENNESRGLEDAEGVIPRQLVVTGAEQASVTTAHVEQVVEEVGQTNALEPGLVTSPAISPHLVAFHSPAAGASSSVIALPAVFSDMPLHPQPVVGKAVVAHAAECVADIPATIRTSTASSSSNGIVPSGGCHGDSGVNAGLWFADFQLPSAQAERPKRSRDLHEDVEDLLKKFRRPVPRLL